MQNIDVLRFKNILLTQCLLSTNNKVVVGVSGGPDSLCLLDLLARVKLPVLVAHYDHHLRPESGEDALRVRQAAARYGFPFFLGESDVAAYARQQKASIEEAARDCRYRFLFETAVNQQAEAVLVAHTADDQVETVLMHLLRGSGLAGLKGMTYRCVLETWNDRIPLLRPLLAYWREDILTYCQERGLQPVMDATNADITYFRNRLRHELIPYLSEYNPQFKRVLWRMALNLGGDFELVQDLTQHQAEALILAVESDAVVLKYTDLKLLNSGLQRNMLRMAIQKLRPALRDINFEAIERALDFIRRPTRSHRMDLVDGLWLYQREDQLIIASPDSTLLSGGWPACERATPFEIPVPGLLQINSEWQLQVEELRTCDPQAQLVDDPYQAFLDADQITQPLMVRTWRPGDRLQPLGMQGHLKLSDLFINRHVAEQARKKYPLVCSGDEIIWVPGLRLAQRGAVQATTRVILHLTLLPVTLTAHQPTDVV